MTHNDLTTTTQPTHQAERPLTPEERAEERMLQNIGPSLQEKIDQIRDWYAGESRHGLLQHYQLGKLVREVYDDQDKHYTEQRYGQHAMKKICHALPWCKSSLYDALHLVAAYTEEEVMQLSQRHMASGEPLSWSHIRLTLAVTDKRRRLELLERVFEKSMTCQELAQEIRRASPPKETKRGGQPRAPRNLDEAIRQQATLADKFLDRSEKVWREDHSLTDLSQNLDPEEYTEARAQELMVHWHKLDRAAQEMAQKAQEARDVYERFLKEMDRRKARGAEDHGKAASEQVEEPDCEDAACEIESALAVA